MPSKYRIHSGKLFLTYPQCPIPKEDAISIIFYIFTEENIDEYIIAEEEHKNGDKHLHVYLKLKVQNTYTNPSFADLSYNNEWYHGNYQGCRSEKNVIKYCSKEENYLSNFDVGARIQKKNSHKRVLADALINKKINLVQAVQEEPELLFGYKKLKADLFEYFKDEQDRREAFPDWIPNPWGKVMSSKISQKRRHYWIFSRQPNKGKTFLFAKPLERKYRCLVQSGDFSYWNVSGQEETIILDEYNNASLKYYILNCMADGTFAYRVFMGGLVRLHDPLIIILSNQCINDLYPNMNLLLHERFIEIELI